jgi:poly-beta-1,6-N-acetyl-D-glucosamine synthase
LKISIGICAYNEEQNLGRLLEALSNKYPFEIIVVASGCTDNTIPIAKKYDCKVIEQKKREGKASAINLFLEQATGDILVLQSADTLPTSFTYKYLIEPMLMDRRIGMVGCHPIPINSKGSLIDKTGQLLWQTHHYMAMKHPKAGEVCAFRNVIKKINPKTSVDEASIEYQIVKAGYKVVYAEDAIIFNKAPTSVDDFMKQRKRIYLGHMKLKDEGYQVATMNQVEVLKATLKATHDPLLLAYAAWLEAVARYKAKLDYDKNSDNHIWDMVDTTKRLN